MLKPAILAIFLTFSTFSQARDYVIYSVDRELPMGTPGEVIKKNFYVNIGLEQGVRSGTELEVFRIISIQNPYDNKKRVNYKVSIGKLKVIHSNENAAIATASKRDLGPAKPIFAVRDFMIGDHVSVYIDD